MSLSRKSEGDMGLAELREPALISSRPETSLWGREAGQLLPGVCRHILGSPGDTQLPGQAAMPVLHPLQHPASMVGDPFLLLGSWWLFPSPAAA